MVKIITAITSVAIAIAIGFFLGSKWAQSLEEKGQLSSPTPIPTPFSKYSVENLSKAQIKSGKFQITETISQEEKYASSLFKFTFDPEITSGSFKTTTGQINIPTSIPGNESYPLIIMIRGYVDQNLYTTGMGTSSGAKYFAENGFITVSPDYLGYAGSDPESSNIFETRFQTYVTTLSLIKSLDQISQWNGKDIFIWAHSNGGQIALTVLESTGATIPTTLWAPVSKPFPYSVLYYTDESEDRGKFIRSELSEFEKVYNADLYAITDYFDRIKSPILLHQGTNDDAIPVEWSNSLNSKLKAAGVEIEYFIYPGADHNMRPHWDSAISRDLNFFKENLSR